MEFDAEVFFEHQTGILINVRLLMNRGNIKLPKFIMGLLHAVLGMSWDFSVQLVLDRLEVFGDVVSNLRSLWLLRKKSVSLSIQCLFAVAPSDDGIDVRRENRCNPSISRLLTDVHGDVAIRVLG